MLQLKKWLVISLLCSALTGPVLLAADKVPQPKGWVNDYAGVISNEYRDKLNDLIRALEEKTSAEIAVVSVDSIAPYGEREYARLLFDSWRPGKKGKDNGILILLAVKERRWRIETGYGIEGVLPDGLCGEIGRNYMVPYFKEGRYDEGLYSGVAAIAKAISQEGRASIKTYPINPAYVPLLIIIVMILIIVIRLAEGYERYHYYGGGRVGGGFGGGGFGGGGFGGGGFGGGGGGGGGAGGGF